PASAVDLQGDEPGERDRKAKKEPKCRRQPARTTGSPEPVPAQPATAFAGCREQGFAEFGARRRIARRICLEDRGYYPEWIIRVLVVSRLLTGRQFDPGMRQSLVGNL